MKKNQNNRKIKKWNLLLGTLGIGVLCVPTFVLTNTIINKNLIQNNQINKILQDSTTTTYSDASDAPAVQSSFTFYYDFEKNETYDSPTTSCTECRLSFLFQFQGIQNSNNNGYQNNTKILGIQLQCDVITNEEWTDYYSKTTNINSVFQNAINIYLSDVFVPNDPDGIADLSVEGISIDFSPNVEGQGTDPGYQNMSLGSYKIVNNYLNDLNNEKEKNNELNNTNKQNLEKINTLNNTQIALIVIMVLLIVVIAILIFVMIRSKKRMKE